MSPAPRRAPPADHVTFALVALRLRARSAAEAWDALEHDVAPVALRVDGVRDLHLPLRRDIAMAGTDEADCRVRLTICAPDHRAAFALTEGAVRHAVAGLAPVISVASITMPVSPLWPLRAAGEPRAGSVMVPDAAIACSRQA
jgi:hypothetical protein